MRTGLKVVAGLLSVAPFVSSVVMGVVVGVRLVLADIRAGGSGTFSPLPFDTDDYVLFALALSIVVLLQLGTCLGFIFHAAREPRVDGIWKAIWIIAFLLVGMAAMPAYFVIYMWREPPPARVADLDRPPLARPVG